MKQESRGRGCWSWFCPSIIGVVAGLIMLNAGITKLIAGTQAFSMVGGMALGLVGLELPSVALVLGGIVAVVETLGGISILIGCKKTSKYAATLLAIIMLVAVLIKIKGFSIGEGKTGYMIVSSFISSLQLDLLLLAIFVHKSWKFVCRCCGMKCGECCGGGECATK